MKINLQVDIAYVEGFSWPYLDNEHFNLYDKDIGITKTFLNI